MSKTDTSHKYKLWINTIEGETHKKLQDIFNDVVVKTKNDKKNITQITKIYNDKKQINTLEELYIKDCAILYLESAGFRIYSNHFMIEYWRHRCFADKLEPTLDRHMDSYSVMTCPVYTCIFYLRKDSTMKGGNLNIYGNGPYGRFLLNPLEIIETTPKVVCFNGSIIHSITNFKGCGIRDAIVVQFEKEWKTKSLPLGIKYKSYS